MGLTRVQLVVYSESFYEGDSTGVSFDLVDLNVLKFKVNTFSVL